MKLIIIMGLMFVLMTSLCLGYAMERQLPTSVAPGDTFNVRYQVTEGTGNFGVLFEEDVTGCTPSHISSGFMSPVMFADIQYTAPNSGSCSFSGNYQFAGASGSEDEVNFPSGTVSVGNPADCTMASDCGTDSTCLEYSCTGGACESNAVNEGSSCTLGAQTGTCQSGVCYVSGGNGGTTGGSDFDISDFMVPIFIFFGLLIMVSVLGRR